METERTTVILRKLGDGSLPTTPCATLWGGTGTGVRCGACEQPISAPQIEFECHGSDGVIVHLCRPCFAIWDAHVTRRV